MKVTIYGASDDLIEAEGDLSEEWSHYDDDEPARLAFSDGTVATITYGADGAFWRIKVLERGTGTIEHVPGTDEDTDYSDKLTVDGVEWVECNGRRCPDRRKASHQRRAEDQ